MEDGNLTVSLGGSAATEHLVSGQPCTLLGFWFYTDGSDAGTPGLFPLTVELVDEADTANITSSSKSLYIAEVMDPTQLPDPANFAIKAGKGICVKIGAQGTNTTKVGIVWR